MVAAMARYHRRSLPKKRHESWQLIGSREDRRTVSTMALLLRLAAALDRRPDQMVAELKVRRVGSAAFEVILVPEPASNGEGWQDLSLECWSLRSLAPVVLEASGLELKVRVLAAEPLPAFPGVPTVGQTVQGYVVTTWAGLAGPAALPAPVLQRLHQAVITISEQPEHRTRLAALVDGRVRTSSSEELRSLVSSEIARWRELIASRNLTAG
jgi:hypothetical protein